MDVGGTAQASANSARLALHPVLLCDRATVICSVRGCSTGHFGSGVNALALHDLAQVIHHFRGIFKVFIIHAFLGVVDFPNGVAGEAPGILVVVKAVPDEGAVLDLDRKTERMRARQIGSGKAAGIGEVAFGHG